MYGDHDLKIHISYSVAIFLYDKCIAQISSHEKKTIKKIKKAVSYIRIEWIKPFIADCMLELFSKYTHNTQAIDEQWVPTLQPVSFNQISQ